jgi:hypothetical protein
MNGYLGINSFPRGQSSQLQVDWLYEFFRQNCLLQATATLESATAATPVVVVPREEIPAGFRVQVVGFRAKVNGATAYGSGDEISLKTESGNVVFALAGSALTANALLLPGQSGVTVSDEFARGEGVPDPDEGLQISGAADTTGSDLVVTVYYRFAR